MSLTFLIAGLAIALTFGVLTYDEDNTWKVIACGLVLVVAGIVQRMDVRIHSYNKGYEDGICAAFKIVDAKEGINLDNLPEYCDG